MSLAPRQPYVAPEHEFEPQPGLPENLPSGERLLWQGAPVWTVLARRSFHVDKVAIYFAALLVWRFAGLLHGGATLGEASSAMIGWALLAGLGVGLLATLAWMSARTTVYTLTDRRIVMRIGIVLTVTYNFPLKRIDSADLRPFGRSGRGDIALALERGTRIAWLHLWPHVRPWRVARPQPTLRALADAQSVSRLLADAWSQANGQAAQLAPRASASTGQGGSQPVLAAH